MGGYVTEDVDRLLEEVTSSYEEVWLEREELRRRVEELGTELDRYREIEDLLRETLAEGRRAADRLKEESEREARTILEEARGRAAAVLEERKAEEKHAETRISDLRAAAREVVDRLRSALLGSLELVDRVDRASGDEGAADDVDAGEARSGDEANDYREAVSSAPAG